MPGWDNVAQKFGLVFLKWRTISITTRHPNRADVKLIHSSRDLSVTPDFVHRRKCFAGHWHVAVYSDGSPYIRNVSQCEENEEHQGGG